MSESVILCEGYHDRAFWAGWLLSLGCTDPGAPPDGGVRIPVKDPWNRTVSGGQFGFHSASGKFLRIIACHGYPNVLRLADSRLQDRSDKELARMVLSVDSDVYVNGSGSGSPRLTQQTLAQQLQKFGQPDVNQHGDYVLDGGATVISVVRWEASDPPAAGLPARQTLERLVCAGLVAAYPERGTTVQTWLHSRPNAPTAGPKEYGWSHMAGWYAEHGCEAFLRCLWNEAAVVAQLEPRLRDSGAWRVAEALVQ